MVVSFLYHRISLIMIKLKQSLIMFLLTLKEVKQLQTIHLMRKLARQYQINPAINKMFLVCSSLTYLDFSFQAITKIPGSIRMLKKLKVLKLKYCVYLEQLSPKLGLLKLKELDLTGCISLKTPPKEIQKRGVVSILAYLNRLGDGFVQCKRTKLMMQGLGSAGKLN